MKIELKDVADVLVTVAFGWTLYSICGTAKAGTKPPSPPPTYEYRLCTTDRTNPPIRWTCGDWGRDQHQLVDYITLMKDTVWVYRIEEREVRK